MSSKLYVREKEREMVAIERCVVFVAARGAK